MHAFMGRTANVVWRQAARALLEETDRLQASRAGDTRELQDVLFSIEDPRQRWISCRLPAMNPAFAIAEVVWIVNGRNDSAFLNFWNPVLPRFQGDGETYHGAYGWRLRNAFGFDQIARGYHALRSDPNTRQVVLQIWNPSADLPLEDGKPRSKDIPCNVCSMLKVRDGKLEWTQIMRSNDLVRGLPHNVVQFTYLQELMAAWLDIGLGAYTHLSDSLHVYKDQVASIDDIGEDLPETAAEPWTLGYAETAKVFEVMGMQMDRMRKCETEEDILLAAQGGDLPRQARNMLMIAGSDAARRKGWPNAARATMMECKDSTLSALLKLWYKRKGFMIHG